MQNNNCCKPTGALRPWVILLISGLIALLFTLLMLMFDLLLPLPLIIVSYLTGTLSIVLIFHLIAHRASLACLRWYAPLMLLAAFTLFILATLILLLDTSVEFVVSGYLLFPVLMALFVDAICGFVLARCMISGRLKD